MRRAVRMAGAAVVLGSIVLAGPATPVGAVGADPGTDALPTSVDEAIDNVVVIVQQNHTYDSYFGNYPRGRGYDEVEVWPADSDDEPVEPFLWTDESIEPYRPPEGLEPLANGPIAAEVAMSDGAMDGFVRAQENRGFLGHLTMATHDRTTAPVLWDLADDYVLFDNYFSSARGGSMTNLLHLFTGDDHGIRVGTKATLAELAGLDPPTMFDRLGEGGVDWGFYSGQLEDLDVDRLRERDFEQEDKSPILYWAPFLVSSRFWDDHDDRVHEQEQFYVDAANGALPAVSVLLPRATDHPMNVSAGHERLRSLVNAVIKGPQWSRTAVFVVWDEWGGFYDHVPPPPGFGFRVPMLLISPWAKQGYVASEQHDHTSVLAFVLDRFGLRPMSERYGSVGSFDEAFDLASGPRTVGLLGGEELPTPPVGSGHENSLTLRLYLAVAAAVTVAAVPAARYAARRSHGSPTGSPTQLAESWSVTPPSTGAPRP